MASMDAAINTAMTLIDECVASSDRFHGVYVS